MWRYLSGGAAATLLVMMVLWNRSLHRPEPRIPPRRGGAASPVIFAPRHRQLAARPELHLVSPNSELPLLLRILRPGRSACHALLPGLHPWPEQEPDLREGEIVTLLLQSDAGVDRTEAWMATRREVALWERGGRCAAQRMESNGFPGPALVAAAAAGTVLDGAGLRVALPSALRLKAARAWPSADEAEQR